MLLSVLPVNLLGVMKVDADSSQTEVNQEIQNFQAQLDSKLAQANKIYSQAQEAQQKLISQRVRLLNWKQESLKLKMTLFSLKPLSRNKCEQCKQMVGELYHILISLHHQKSFRYDYAFNKLACGINC